MTNNISNVVCIRARIQKYAERNTERICQSLQVVQTDVAFTAFNSTHISSMQAAMCCQCFLAPALLLAQMPQIGRQ